VARTRKSLVNARNQQLTTIEDDDGKKKEAQGTEHPMTHFVSEFLSLDLSSKTQCEQRKPSGDGQLLHEEEEEEV
jgi:hypothetical protein